METIRNIIFTSCVIIAITVLVLILAYAKSPGQHEQTPITETTEVEITKVS